MKKHLPVFIFLFGVFFAKASQTPEQRDALPENSFAAFFEKAYSEHPSIPKGVLEAVAYTNSRFHHIEHHPGDAESCMGLPFYYGVMGLVQDGKKYFQNNLTVVSTLSGISEKEIITSPEKNILAYAAAYEKTQTQLLVDSKIENQVPVLTFLSELPDMVSLGSNYAMCTHLYSVLTFLNSEKCSAQYNFPKYEINLAKIFGEENLKVLSSSFVTVSSEKISDKQGNNFKGTTLPVTNTADYGPALWVSSPNYSSRSGTLISAVTIHDVEGSYAGCISWFQNTSSQVSAHYVMRSSDGQCTQMVLESNKAWHVGSENPYTIGIEHEGYYNQTGWYTTAMYTQSAKLVCDICNSGYGINPTTCWNGPSCNGTCVISSTYRIKGHQHYPNQTHNDPGLNWDWYTYYNLINSCGGPAPTPTALAAQVNACPQIGVTLNWQNSGANWYVDVTDDPTFTNYWNKAVPNLTSIGCPGGFANINVPTDYLGFMPNTTYYWRIWDGTAHTAGASFTTPTCAYTESTCSGTLDDTGGPSAAYTGNEDWTDVIQPANASSVTVNFTSFDLELNSDSLYIYNGPSTASPLIGGYTGTTSPGTKTANSGVMTLHFVSDPFVNNAGWTATWSCVSTTGIESVIGNQSSVEIFPNPFSESTTISVRSQELGVGRLELKIYDVYVKEVRHSEFQTPNSKLERGSLASGIYMLKISDGNKSVFSKLIIE